MTYSLAPRSLTASTTLDRGYANCPVILNAAAGLTVTLPAASGTGDVYEILVGTTVTSNTAVVKVANATDVMRGAAFLAADGGDTAVAFEAASTVDTITMDGSTRGGIAGDRIRLVDMAAGFWSVQMTGTASGTEATPFSATVS